MSEKQFQNYMLAEKERVTEVINTLSPCLKRVTKPTPLTISTMRHAYDLLRRYAKLIDGIIAGNRPTLAQDYSDAERYRFLQGSEYVLSYESKTVTFTLQVDAWNEQHILPLNDIIDKGIAAEGVGGAA